MPENMGIVWESVLQRVEKGSTLLAILVRDVRRAEEGEARRKAEKELGSVFALEIAATGRESELGILPEESDALARVAAGFPYEETPRADPAVEAQARREQNAAILAEVEKEQNATRAAGR